MSSSTITLDSARSIPECSECGDNASTELLGTDGIMYPLCANCDVWWRETQAEEDAVSGTCQDCHRGPATRRFIHLRKGEFFLCGGCFSWADHEDDYLEHCDCGVPEGETGQTHCSRCTRVLRATTAFCSCAVPETRGLERIDCRLCWGRIRIAAPRLCNCSVVATVDGDESTCLLCHGYVPPLAKDEPEYDWGVEQEGDFPAEEPESDEEDDDWATEGMEWIDSQ